MKTAGWRNGLVNVAQFDCSVDVRKQSQSMKFVGLQEFVYLTFCLLFVQC